MRSIRDLVRAERAAENRAAYETGVGGFWDDWNERMEALNREWDKWFATPRIVARWSSTEIRAFEGLVP